MESYESIPRRAHRPIPYARTHARNAHTNPTHTHTVAHSRRRRPITHRPSSSSIHATHVSSSPSRAKSASKSVLTRIARSIGARARDRIGSDRTRGVIIPPSLPPSRNLCARTRTHTAHEHRRVCDYMTRGCVHNKYKKKSHAVRASRPTTFCPRRVARTDRSSRARRVVRAKINIFGVCVCVRTFGAPSVRTFGVVVHTIRATRIEDRWVLLVYTTSCGHITDGVGSVGYTNTHTEGDVMAMTGFYLCFHMKSVSVARRVCIQKKWMRWTVFKA